VEQGTGLEQRVAVLKETIAGQPGRNVADASFVQAVEELLGVFYEDIGQIKHIRLRSLFDLFLIKVLYVDRHSQDGAVLDYLGELLARFLWSRELLPRVQYDFLFAILAELEESHRAQNVFEASRKLADNALFVTGIFPGAVGPRRLRGRRAEPRPRFEREHFVELGRRYYRLAADEELAEVVGQRDTLRKLANYFEVYAGALNEMSERYITGFDMNLIADKMLDSFNQYRRSGERQHLETAQKYAALLRIDRRRFPRLFGRPPGG